MAEAAETLRATAAQGSAHKAISEDSDVSDGKVNEPLVSFAESKRQETSYESSDGERGEKTPSGSHPIHTHIGPLQERSPTMNRTG